MSPPDRPLSAEKARLHAANAGREAWRLWGPYLSDRQWGTVNIDRALAAGMTFRSLADTVRDTLDWVRREPRPLPLQAGLTPEREAELLAAWKKR